MDRDQRQQEIDEKEWAKMENWRYGMFYYSLVDSRTWVPKRSMFGRRRFGGTPNFARREARAYMMIIMGILVLLVLLVIAYENS